MPPTDPRDSARLTDHDCCKTCRWWRYRDARGHGICTRYPPASTRDGVALWPRTTAVDGCGEHQQAEKPDD